MLPDLVIELKVTKADVKYDNLKFEHIAGIGGEGAQLIGELAHAALTQWRPSIEKDALAKANAGTTRGKSGCLDGRLAVDCLEFPA